MSILDFEQTTKHGFLDTDAVNDGEALDPFRLSVIAKNHNTAIDERECVLNMLFDAELNSAGVGTWQRQFGMSGWQPIFMPMHFMKRPHTREIEVAVYGESENVKFQIQAVTARQSFRPNAQPGDPGVITLLNAAIPLVQRTTVRVNPGVTDTLYLFGKTARGEELGDAPTFGRATGAIGAGTDFFVGTNFLHWESGAVPPADVWVSSPFSAATYAQNGSFIAFFYGPASDEPAIVPRNIWLVERANAGFNRIRFNPPISAEEAKRLNEGGKFEIHKVQSVRINSISAFESRRV